ncbi:hypothetical protein C8J57DRAFT_1086893, partial [Mycena rebaudengoi]
LQLYKDLTLKFSQEGVTTIAHVIPSMDRIDQMLTTSRQDTALNPAVAAALINAKRVMNKYYSKTDLSYVYRIAMTLHPGLKLRYFQAHRWTQEWIDEALSIVKGEFGLYVDKARLSALDNGVSSFSAFFFQ